MVGLGAGCRIGLQHPVGGFGSHIVLQHLPAGRRRKARRVDIRLELFHYKRLKSVAAIDMQDSGSRCRFAISSDYLYHKADFAIGMHDLGTALRVIEVEQVEGWRIHVVQAECGGDFLIVRRAVVDVGIVIIELEVNRGDQRVYRGIPGSQLAPHNQHAEEQGS